MNLETQVRAEALLRRAVAIQEEALGEGHPSFATTLSILAGVLRKRKDLAGAEPFLRRALAIRGAWKAGALPGLIDARTSDADLPYFVGDVGAPIVAAPSWRSAVRRRLWPVKAPIAAPRLNAATTPIAIEAATAGPPESANHGASGRTAPMANETNDASAACTADPGCRGSTPSSRRAWVSSATSGFDMRMCATSSASGRVMPSAVYI